MLFKALETWAASFTGQNWRGLPRNEPRVGANVDCRLSTFYSQDGLPSDSRSMYGAALTWSRTDGCQRTIELF